MRWSDIEENYKVWRDCDKVYDSEGEELSVDWGNGGQEGCPKNIRISAGTREAEDELEEEEEQEQEREGKVSRGQKDDDKKEEDAQRAGASKKKKKRWRDVVERVRKETRGKSCA